ncbi:MAG: amino acid adenylation domain-containing protein [Acidaminococcaceae bacterium]|nr:amino acid adenylation domain-containing protein [Acidaminococcaceae bacterium]
MNKTEWCESRFGSEMPDCLPLPELREVTGGQWEEFVLPAEDLPETKYLAVGTLLLLGVYGGICEAGFLVWDANGYRPLRREWHPDTKPEALAESTEAMLREGASFSWKDREAQDVLGLEEGRGMALSLAGEIPATSREGLALSFRRAAEGLAIGYHSSLYTEAFIRTMALSWREILQSLPRAATVSHVRITAPETLARLDRFNETVHPYDRSATIVEQFWTRAAEYPDNTAVIYEERSYTYAQVKGLASRLAGFISGQGLGRGDTVAVFIPRSEYMVIASLGVMRAGCAYEPLDPNYPDERLSFMVKDAGAKLIIIADELLPRLENFQEFDGTVLRISGIQSLELPEEASLAKIAPPLPDDLFMLIYTSGTTGVPKGVRLLQKNIMAYAAWYRRYFSPAATSRVTCYNSYGFDGSLADMYPALTVGAGVVVIPEEKKLDLPALAEIIKKHHVYIADLPSQVGRQFALSMDCPELKYIVVGGETLVPFKPVHPYIVANEYGPTEATVSITCYSMTEYEPDIPIGTPMDNTDIYIVDNAGRRVPPGALGELWVAGIQVAGGYLNRPEKTAEAFVPNPFSKKPDYETAYRTGDIARYRLDGNIEFVGRRDGLVKIRGFRVELAEVEGVVHDFPAVKNAVVVACDNPAGGKFIAAYVVADEPIDREALAAFIRERKPPYMVPAAVVQLDAIPWNQNGKLNRKALPKPEVYASETPYVAPKNPTEELLAKGFAAALGMERVSAEEDFFEAGGDSLSVVRLLAECRDLKLNFNLVYEGKNPAGIAKLLALREDKSALKTIRRDTHFFGPLQELHYEWGNELEEGYGLHCDATVYLAPETDMERLAAAIETVLQAHPAVDARLTASGDGTLRWKSGDLANLKPAVEEVTRQDYEELKPKLRQPMNKPETRMFSMRLFAIREANGTTSKEFYFDFLHPIIDGDSITIFLEDVDAAYRGEALQPEEYSILDYYDDIEDALNTPEYEKEQKWNEEFIRSFTEHAGELPGDLDPKEENKTVDKTVPLHVDLAAVDAFTKVQGVTDGSILAAAFGLLQSLANGEKASAVLTIYNGRDDIRYERTLGAIYRHYPLCVRWKEDMTAAQFVKETQENVLLCRRHALYEGDAVPLIAAFSYQGEDIDGEFDFCGGKARYEEVEDFEEEVFEFFLHRRKDDFYVNLTYNTLEYSETFIDRFLKNYALVLHGLAAGENVGDIVKKLDC